MKCLIIGGSKSGKSEIGEKISLSLNKNKVIYIATMKPYDKEDEERIKKHIQNRIGLNFVTIEKQSNLHEIIVDVKSDETVLIDSITSLLTNEMFIEKNIIKNPSMNILMGLKQIMNKVKNIVIVSDYIFNDAIEYDEITESFKKELATINIELASLCDNVIECSFGNIRYHKCKEKII